MKALSFAKACASISIRLIALVTTRIFPTLVSLLLLGFPYKADAAQLPAQVVTSLQQREDRLQHLTFAWQIELQQSAPDKPQDQVVAMQKAIERQLPDQLRKEGIVDENTILKQIEEAKQQVPVTMKGFSYSSTNLWRFERDGTQTLVTGVKQLGASRASFTQYYDKRSGVISNNNMSFTNAGPLRGADPEAWESPGDSVRYRSLFQQSLGLLPEHYAMLLGLNPLAMYGAKWDLVSTTSTALIMQTRVSQNNFAPFTIQLTLSRKYNGAPSQLRVQSKDETINFQADNFRQIGNDWIADKATFSQKWVGYLTTNQTWTLQDITQSKPIVVALPQKHLVHDYRLLGPSLTIQGLGPAVSEQQKKSIVYYSWPGHFPSNEELKQMFQKQHPGEPLPNQSGSNSIGTDPAEVAGLVVGERGGTR